ncbi:MAG: hypothetical protein Q8O84_00760, partial [Nanoarchaeota archaeon]|nr:hypothetical protein [Nanoarchaeota archaeon]
MKDLALHKQIKEKLIQNQKVVLTNVDEHIHLPNIKKYPHYEAGFAHLIYFYIAPKEKMHR